MDKAGQVFDKIAIEEITLPTVGAGIGAFSTRKQYIPITGKETRELGLYNKYLKIKQGIKDRKAVGGRARYQKRIGEMTVIRKVHSKFKKDNLIPHTPRGARQAAKKRFIKRYNVLASKKLPMASKMWRTAGKGALGAALGVGVHLITN